MIKVVKGDILQATENIIGHQVNCQGVMGAGLAAKLRSKYSNVFDRYKEFVNGISDKELLLGNAQVIRVDDEKFVANLYGQLTYGRTGVHTNYIALDYALSLLKEKARKYNLSVALPHGIGCGLAGGNWNKVEGIIERVFSDYEVTLYKFK